MAVTKIQAKYGTFAYASSAVTWDTSTTAASEAFTGNVSEVKDVTVEMPAQEVSTELCLGATAQTIGANARTAGTATGPVAGTWQNAMLHRKSVSNWKVTGTMVFTGDEQWQNVLGLNSGTTVNTTYTRYGVGTIASNNWDCKLLGSVRLALNNGSEEFTVVLTNAAVTNQGPLKPTGADGYFEVEFSAECLPKDGIIEWKN